MCIQKRQADEEISGILLIRIHYVYGWFIHAAEWMSIMRNILPIGCLLCHMQTE